MKRKFTLFFLVSAMIFTSCDVIQQMAQQSIRVPLSNEEVIKGLKNALTISTDSSVSRLRKTDGYFNDAMIKLALPEEANRIVLNLSKIPGGQKLLNDAILSINRAAEDAAPQAKDIFVNAITNISIDDGFKILRGDQTAATEYLKSKTFQELTNAFSPKIKSSLSKPLILGVSAETAYQKLIDTYNLASLSGVLWSKINQNSLSAYTTQKALDGLFLKVANEEKLIRQDPLHRVNELLEKVFSGN